MPELTLQQAFDLATQHQQAGRLHEAERIYRQILAGDPRNAQAMHLLGVLAIQVGRGDVAVDLIRAAIAVNPNFPQFHNDLAMTQWNMGRFDQAIAAARAGIALHPNIPELYGTLGNALSDNGQFDEAIAAFQKALSLNATLSGAHNNLGNIFKALGRFDDAVAAYRQAILIDPDVAHVHVSLAYLLLTIGRFAEGWQEFEWRLKDPRLNLRRDFAPPQWNGQDLSGKTLLVHTEGGFGDAINLIRYVPLLRGRANKLILECRPTLMKLFADVPGVDEIIARDQPLPPFDYHIPLQSLPRIFGTDLTNIPVHVPYLKVPAAYQARWNSRVERDGRFNVGLAWAGSPIDTGDARTRTLDIFAPLARIPNVRFFSLQKGPESSLPRPGGLELIDFTHDLNDFSDTAALVEQLDLVISVDTSVAHLASALAKPVWVLIPYWPDFRWLLHRADSPWYPTMRLFRQRTRNNWADVIEEIATDLRD